SGPAFTGIKVASNGMIYACSGTNVWSIDEKGVGIALECGQDVDMISLAVFPNGSVLAGTGNGAELYSSETADTTPKATYESVVHDAKSRSRWGTLRWNGGNAQDASVLFQTRTGDVAEPDGTWSAWSSPAPNGDGLRITSPEARYIQYRAAFPNSN